MHSLVERFSLTSVIDGLALDLKSLRSAEITIEDARVRAELAKQMIAGIRVYLQAQKFLEKNLPDNSNPILPSHD
jgi:hypothetical protein